MSRICSDFQQIFTNLRLRRGLRLPLSPISLSRLARASHFREKIAQRCNADCAVSYVTPKFRRFFSSKGQALTSRTTNLYISCLNQHFIIKREVNPLEVIKKQIKFFIERGNYMKKVICLFSAFLLLLSSAMVTYEHETDSQDYLSIPSYNETYSAQPTDNDFLSLKEYNAEYSHKLF